MGSRGRRVWASIVVGLTVLGWLLAGSLPAAGQVAADADAEVGQGTPGSFPKYYVYLQPIPNQNPLFQAVRGFQTLHTTIQNNRALWYEPHITVTTFFQQGHPAQAEIVQQITQAISAVGGRPFGEPIVRPPDCRQGEHPKLIKLPVDVVTNSPPATGGQHRKYRAFSEEVSQRLHAQRIQVTSYHLTLFQEVPKNPISPAGRDQLCSLAHAAWDAGDFRSNANWRIALYRADAEVSDSNPLTQTNLVYSWPINP